METTQIIKEKAGFFSVVKTSDNGISKEQRAFSVGDLVNLLIKKGLISENDILSSEVGL